MRNRTPIDRLYRLGVAVGVIAMLGATPAGAQGFLESLFGVFAPKPKPQAMPPARERSGSAGQGEVRANPFDTGRGQSFSGGSGRYKTMCVRLCDGFYFPISNAARRQEFYRDAEQCQSQCQSETRLFYMSKTAGSIESARDQSGLYYKELTNAFLYREKLDKSCTCRPTPWSEAERRRHERYAMIEAGELKPGDAVAEGEAGAAANDGGGAVDVGEAPQPALAVRQREFGQGSGAPEWQQARPVNVRARPEKPPAPPPAFGLGALFGGGSGGAPASNKAFKNKFRWPGDDGN